MTIVETPAGPVVSGLDDREAAAILADPEFRTLVARRARLGAAVVVPMLVIYFGYILALIAAPGLMRARIGQTITVGFPLGCAVMIATFLLVLFYVYRSRERLDPLTRDIAGRYVR